MNQAFLIQAAGLLAPVLFLTAYALVSLGKWQPTMLRFHVLNFVGALLILLSLSVQWNLPVCILEVCWAAISLYGIGKALARRRAQR